MSQTPAHEQRETIRLIVAYPEHLPRESDPHYKAFHEARKRLERLGALKCWIGNAECSPGPIELHHDKVEFSLIPDVDVSKFDEAYGLHLTDDEFLTYVEGEGNLLPLCAQHHRGHLGIHSLPYPFFVVQKYLKAGVAAPARVVTNEEASHNAGTSRSGSRGDARSLNEIGGGC